MIGLPSAAVVIAALTLYAMALIAAAWRADRAARQAISPSRRPLAYALSLATMCWAWNHFSAVGTASWGSWLFLAAALGPALAFSLGYPVWRRIAALAEQENISSLADFLAARYGKSGALGALCALVAVAGMLPFAALQVNLLGSVWHVVADPIGYGGMAMIAPLAILATGTLLIAARRVRLNRADAAASTLLSIDACMKLAGLIGAAGVAAVALIQNPAVAYTAPPGPPVRQGISFLALTALFTATAFTVPRQFHAGFVMARGAVETRAARWIVPLYMMAGAAATLVLALAIRRDISLAALSPELRALAWTADHGGNGLSLFVLIGGVSAGATMVVAELMATATMVTNEAMFPLVRRLIWPRHPVHDMGRIITLARQLSVALLGLLIWAYHHTIGRSVAADQLILIALTAFAQFLPALIGGLYWRRGHLHGALAGIAAGALLWLVTIAAPPVVAAMHGQSARDWGHETERTMELAMVLSLSVNVLLYVVFSILARPRMIDTTQARLFAGAGAETIETDPTRIRARLSDVEGLLTRFAGRDDAARAMAEITARTPDQPQTPDDPITSAQARTVERRLAGLIGAASARTVVSDAISSEGLTAKEVDRILDEAAHAVHFSRDLLQDALQGLSQGISVVDRNHRLVAWNASYMHLLNLSLSEVYIGKPLSELLLERRDAEAVHAIRSNLLGLNGSIARDEPLEEEWHLEDGRILQVTGKPLASGDYLSTLVDISRLREAERILAQDKEALERRVDLRTRELQVANAALDEAKRAAEEASEAQKRFVAAASHDLVQPLHAARLFISTVQDGAGLGPSHVDLLRRADEAVDGAFRLMKALLNLSQLETNAAEPAVGPVSLDTIFASLCEEFAHQAEARGLRFVVRPTSFFVQSDRDLLRSILQNLVLNAIRYTHAGTIIVAARPDGQNVRLEVRDTGIGIAPASLDTAFSAFNRLPEARQMAQGTGLGLAIVTRICRALNYPINVRSAPHQGSVFSVLVPRSEEAAEPASLFATATPAMLAGKRILYIDDEPEILFGMKALIERWGAEVDTATCADEIPAAPARWSAIVADQLLPGEQGLSILRRMQDRADVRILLTATAKDGWDSELPAEGIQLIRKPAPPLQLRALLAAAGS